MKCSKNEGMDHNVKTNLVLAKAESANVDNCRVIYDLLPIQTCYVYMLLEIHAYMT